jgi:hypothetical protein
MVMIFDNNSNLNLQNLTTTPNDETPQQHQTTTESTEDQFTKDTDDTEDDDDDDENENENLNDSFNENDDIYSDNDDIESSTPLSTSLIESNTNNKQDDCNEFNYKNDNSTVINTTNNKSLSSIQQQQQQQLSGEQLICKICNKIFDNLHRLQRHMMCHDMSPELRKFKCTHCDKAFKFKHHLKVNIIINCH